MIHLLVYSKIRFRVCSSFLGLFAFYHVCIIFLSVIRILKNSLDFDDILKKFNTRNIVIQDGMDSNFWNIFIFGTSL